MKYLINRCKSKVLNYQFNTFSKDMKFNFYLNPKEYISSQIFCNGLHEKYLLEFIFSILPKKYKHGICIDVGANIGNHSLFFSNYYDEIHAFEPVLSTFKALELNVLINGLVSKIKTYNIALSSIVSRLRFFEDQSGDVGRSKVASKGELKPKETIEYFVQSIKGDNYFSGLININMIKIDAEGHETDVIKGFSKSISLNHPIILFEANARDNDLNVMAQLKKLGYKYFYSPQIKYYDLKPSILKYLLRALFSSKFTLIDIDEDFNYLSQLAIASFEELKTG
jgi:FkbM family methyltransferase